MTEFKDDPRLSPDHSPPASRAHYSRLEASPDYCQSTSKRFASSKRFSSDWYSPKPKQTQEPRTHLEKYLHNMRIPITPESIAVLNEEQLLFDFEKKKLFTSNQRLTHIRQSMSFGEQLKKNRDIRKFIITKIGITSKLGRAPLRNYPPRELDVKQLFQETDPSCSRPE